MAEFDDVADSLLAAHCSNLLYERYPELRGMDAEDFAAFCQKLPSHELEWLLYDALPDVPWFWGRE